MSWLDIIILLPLLIGLVRGLMRGLFAELTAILAVIFGLIGTKLWGTTFTIWLIKQFAWQEAICSVVAYVLLFLGITIVLHLIAMLISKLFKAVHLDWLNRLGGGAFGVAKWAVIVLMLVLCLHRLDDQFHFFKEDLKQQSTIYNYTTPLSEKLWAKTKQKIATIKDTTSDKLTENTPKNEQE
jgi:membrane protein required for colicin V production